jgi:acetyltransferase-like isoleucine patch superfamily enzyme
VRWLYKLYLLTMRFESMRMLPVRRWILNRLMGTRHKRLYIHAHVFIGGWWGLRIGDNVTLNRGCYLMAHGGLTIRDDVMIAPAAQIWTATHQTKRGQPMCDQPMSMCPLAIGSDVWIGAGAIVLADIPDGTIIGAGSIVTKPFSDTYTTIAGNPAGVIGVR